MRKITFALAAAAAFAITAPAQATTTLISEDFSSGFGVFTVSGQVGINTGNDYVPCCSTSGSVANMSNPFASFGSGDQPSGTLTSPIFNIVAGQEYDVAFDLAALGAGNESITVTIGLFTFTLPAFANNDLDTTFNPVILSFTGPAQTASLTFTSSGFRSVDTIIDNVVFSTPVDEGVPEPATWAMMLLGFGAIGLAMRRRRIVAALA